MYQDKEAFTLIELLVVVLIIGILSAVALPQYQLAVWKSRFSTVKNLVKSIADAQEVYYLANGEYAADFSKLDVTLRGKKACMTSTSGRYGKCEFEWGLCAMQNYSSNCYIECYLDKEGSRFLRYGSYFKHSQLLPEQIFCQSRDSNLNSLANRICKSETGLSAPTRYEADTFPTYLYR